MDPLEVLKPLVFRKVAIVLKEHLFPSIMDIIANAFLLS
jgi:hypothetical protein